MEPLRLVTELSSLTVYRGLLQEVPLSDFYRLLQISSSTQKPEELAFAWGSFLSSLMEARGDGDFCKAIAFAIQTADNAFSRMAATGQVTSAMAQLAEHDLAILSKVANLNPAQLLHCMEKQWGVELSLPLWHWKEQSLPTAPEMVEQAISFYKANGVGMFAFHRGFLWRGGKLLPIERPDPITLANLKGYTYQRKQIIQNTEAFLQGLPANNCLLYGDRGTGKSSTVKALMNQYYNQGLRVIEVPKESLAQFPELVEMIGSLPLKFLLFIDDLSFSKEDETYATMKALLEGGIAARPQNTLLYATSNRRHLLRESFADREGNEIHRNDTIEESLSLADRFGLSVNFSHPSKQEYLHIVEELAKMHQLQIDSNTLCKEAEEFALLRGGRSPRCAVQFLRMVEAREQQKIQG